MGIESLTLLAFRSKVSAESCWEKTYGTQVLKVLKVLGLGQQRADSGSSSLGHWWQWEWGVALRVKVHEGHGQIYSFCHCQHFL